MTLPDRMTNHLNYEIDLRNIWEYEREVFIPNDKSILDQDDLVAEIRQLIIDAVPSRAIYKTSENESKFDEDYKNFEDCRPSFVNEYKLPYFFHHDVYYSYTEKLIIKREIHNYDYWFALKLRQYDWDLFKIDKFLTFQLVRYYTNNKSTFTDFLDLLLLKYNDKQMISERVIKTVQIWIAKNSIAKKDEKSDLEINSPDSFTLIKFQFNKNYFKENSYHIIEIIEELKTAGFIYQNCNPDHFIAILSGKKIDKNNRVNWKKNVKSLNCFINLLMDFQKVEQFITGKWYTASKCFLVKGKEMAPHKLAKPGGAVIKIVELENIVNKI